MSEDEPESEPNVDPTDLPDDVGVSIEKDVDPEETDEN